MSDIGEGSQYAHDQRTIAGLRAECNRLQDKALRFDLDAAGIEQREREAVELVELRAECVRLRTVLETLLKRHDERTAWFAENIWDEARDVLYGKEKNL